MQYLTSATAVLPAPETAQAWQARVVGKYERSLPNRRADLRTELAARVLALTGCWVPPDDVYADGSLAVAGVDGTTFRLYRHGPLAVVRPCVHCGTGHFESQGIAGPVDLGYALSAWQPLHEDCEDYSSEHPAGW